MRSVMQSNYGRLPSVNMPRSKFNRSHSVKTTFDAGFLIPFMVDEILPGDTVQCRMDALARLATPIHPLMDNMVLESFFFFVPNRLVWHNWERFNGAQDNPGDSVDFVIPKRTVSQWGIGTIGDYMGLPIGKSVTFNALPIRGYNLIYNEYFRHQDLSDEARVDTGNSDNSSLTLRRRTKRRDYFTTALPWPQKDFDNPVTIPLGTTAPIIGIGLRDRQLTGVDVEDNVNIHETGTGSLTREATHVMDSASSLTFELQRTGGADNPRYNPKIHADLSRGLSATIEELRQAFQIQSLQERDARSGTRYTEILQSHFGVRNPDQRLQRPEFLGGGRSNVQITPVQQTSGTGSVSPQGNLAAYGTVMAEDHGFTSSFSEHGYVIGILNVRADLTYSQGIERHWTRETRYDYYWPAFAQLGEQAVLNKELYYSGDPDIDDEAFGFQERHAEYRQKNSRVTGLFRPEGPHASLDAWHLSQEFASTPMLNNVFVREEPPVDRVIAVPTEPHFIFDSYVRYMHTRAMPMFATPASLGRF